MARFPGRLRRRALMRMNVHPVYCTALIAHDEATESMRGLVEAPQDETYI
jgi:hypothetical protein